MILRRDAHAEQSTAQYKRQSFHLVNPPEFNFEIRAPNNRELAVEKTHLRVRPAYAKLNSLPSRSRVNDAEESSAQRRHCR
jgi:hypothetical protein